MSFRTIAKQAGLGSAAYHLWHRPWSILRDSLQAGGPWQQRRTERGRREMEAAAHALPVPPGAPGQPLELHLLTGRRFWYQTAFCLSSFARHANRPLAPAGVELRKLKTWFTLQAWRPPSACILWQYTWVYFE